MDERIIGIILEVFKVDAGIKVDVKEGKIVASKNSLYNIVIFEDIKNVSIYSTWKRGWIGKILLKEEYKRYVKYYNCIKEKLLTKGYKLREIYL